MMAQKVAQLKTMEWKALSERAFPLAAGPRPRSSADVRTGASVSLTSSIIKKSMSVNSFTQEPFGNVYGERAVIQYANFDP
jgi:hypothetical protein